MPRWTRTLSRWVRGPPTVVFHPDYRLPLTSLAARVGFDPRRAEFVVDALVELGVLGEGETQGPELAAWADLARVHDAAWLEAVTEPDTLATIFAVDAWDVPQDTLLDSVRRAVGGTVLAGRLALAQGGAVLNLLGGFHHAKPGSGAGFCALNDLAVAIAALRANGVTVPVNVLDLDAHPPDGLAACLAALPGRPWLGSLSGTAWDAPPGVDETTLPPGTSDAPYLAALDALLDRMPHAGLTFVLAGGDVRAGDPLGALALTEAGVRRRDQRVFDALAGAPSVWLPAGGYRPDAWRVLVGTALVLAGHGTLRIPKTLDPLRARYRRIGSGLDPFKDVTLASDDLDDVLGPRRAHGERLLGRYTRAAVELGLERYGLLEPVRRLGYHALAVTLDHAELGDRFRLHGRGPDGTEHLLAESVLARGHVGSDEVLFVHWLTLRHPLGAFRTGRAPLPGQEVPGLGLAREAGELHRQMAGRLGLAGVAMRPAWLHVAIAMESRMVFADAAEQGIMDALRRDIVGVSLPELSRLASAGALLRGGVPWRWPAALMVEWLVPRPVDEAARAGAAAVRFERAG